MERNITKDLIKWKNSKNRKPLILWGARQVGKTWVLKDFGQKYFEDMVYISFYNNKSLSAIFEKDFMPERIINELSVIMHKEIAKEKTLIIFDEIQNAPKVLESLKYFCEEAREYAIVAAGSLLGVAMHEGISFPVGKVDELHLYPMSFSEFLMASGENQLSEYIENYENKEVNDLSEYYSKYLREYYIVGGMPEVVQCYILNHDYDEVREHQNIILNQYEGDFGKHVPPRELPRIKMVWQSIPIQLAKENKKFFFGTIKQGARSKDYEIALQWLTDAGLIYKVHRVQTPKMPLKAYEDLNTFKIYMLDVGLLGALAELDWRLLLQRNNAFVEFKGSLTEQFVLQELTCETDYSLYYFSTEKSRYEVDFLIQKEANIIPIEVKSETNLHAKSLKAYHDKYLPSLTYRISMSNYKEEDWLINVPLWACKSI